MKYINFSQLRSFHAVAKTESITLASKLLNISQPTITKQIQLLEEFYSINVINRHARGVTLTDLGKKLFEITSRFFELEENAIQLFSSNLNIHKGTLVTGTSGTIGSPQILQVSGIGNSEKLKKNHIKTNDIQIKLLCYRILKKILFVVLFNIQVL